MRAGTSLVAQWIRLSASTAGGLSSIMNPIPGWELRWLMLCGVPPPPPPKKAWGELKKRTKESADVVWATAEISDE